MLAMATRITIVFIALIFLSLPTNARSRFRFPDAGKYNFLEHANSFHESAVVSTGSEGHVSSFEELPSDFICNACLDASRKAEQALADPGLLEKASEISNGICHIVPSDLQDKCKEMLQMHIEQAILFLKDYLSEEKLCNSTGLCSESGKTILMSSIAEGKELSTVRSVGKLMHNMWGILMENRKGYARQTGAQLGFLSKPHLSYAALQGFSVQHIRLNRYSAGILFQITVHPEGQNFLPGASNDSCTTCHEAVDEVLNELKNPATKIKVIKFLLKACENVENHVKECKKLVFEYGPLVLANLEKFLNSNDLCSMIHVCDAGGPRIAETAEGNVAVKEWMVSEM